MSQPVKTEVPDTTDTKPPTDAAGEYLFIILVNAWHFGRKLKW